MSDDAWLRISNRERQVLQIVLRSALRIGKSAKPNKRRAKRSRQRYVEISALLRKLQKARQAADITVGVYGGQVQWASGNPMPIRVLDYDGDAEDLPQVDERGQRCRCWFEPADSGGGVRPSYGARR